MVNINRNQDLLKRVFKKNVFMKIIHECEYISHVFECECEYFDKIIHECEYECEYTQMTMYSNANTNTLPEMNTILS